MASDPRERIQDPADEHRQRLAAIVDSSDDAIVSKDLNGIVTSWNKGAERIFGYSAEEMIGRPIATIAAPEVLDEMPRILDSIRRGEPVEHYETIRRRKDGERIYVALTVSPIRDASGRIIGASKIARDITDRKVAEAERARLLDSEQQARAIAENALNLHRDIEHKLGLLVNASGTLLGALQVTEVLDQIITLARQFVGADAYAVWRADPSLNEWEIVASTGLSEEYCRTCGFTTQPGGQAPSNVLAIEDIEADALISQHRKLYECEGIRSLMAAPMRLHGVNSGTIAIYFRTRHEFTPTELGVATALANLAASAISNAEIYQEQSRLRSEAQARERRSRFLARASGVLGASLDYGATLRDVTRFAVPEFADWCAVDILEPNGRVERLAVEHVDPAKVTIARQLRQRYPIDINAPRGLAQVLREGNPVLYPEVTDEMLTTAAHDEEHLALLRAAGVRSVIVSPMKARGRTLGAITFVTTESGRVYGPEDLAVANQLAARAALAIDNSQLFAEAERERADAQSAVQALRRSNEELEQFAYVSSHDLQEPLRNIASYAQLLATRYRGKLDKDADEFLGYLVDGARRMSVLIQDLLSYSRLIRMGIAPFGPVSGDTALETALVNLQRSINDSAAEIQRDPLPVVWGHEMQISQIFQNLISNAIKYCGDRKPDIRIWARKDNGEAVFCIADKGIGIDPAYHDRIFGLFKRLHGRNVPGTGIGLATCKKIIEQHGGRIWVESNPGEGSAFYFSLPSWDEREPTPAGEKIASPRSL
jgi:PAS domain S-box-containing protein